MSEKDKDEKYSLLENQALDELVECLKNNSEIGAKEKTALQSLKVVQQRNQANTHMLGILWSMRLEVGTSKEKRDFALMSDPTLRKRLN